MTDLANLFAAAFGTVDLPNAACKGRHDIFDLRDPSDPDREDIEAATIAICRDCPELFPCRRWFESLPPGKRPIGVVAGQVNRPKRVKDIA